MWITVDANESRSGLAALLALRWDSVAVKRLAAGDVALGTQVLIERKTARDYVASLGDGRLFHQAGRLARNVERPVFILEGMSEGLVAEKGDGPLRGALLALTVGFRIPVLMTRDLDETAELIRHMAAQESRREAKRRKRREREAREQRAGKPAQHTLPPEAMHVLESLPSVGRVRAEAIARYLTELGDLGRLGLKDLLKVPGIGPDTAARIIDTIRGRCP